MLVTTVLMSSLVSVKTARAGGKPWRMVGYVDLCFNFQVSNEIGM
jgi:hypothetical protein